MMIASTVAGFVTGGGGIIGGFGFSFGESAIGIFASEIANDFLRGFVIGTASSLASGEKFSDALKQGLIGGAISAGGPQFNNLIGHTWGFIASGGQAPTIQNGAFFYKTNFGTAISIGNAITYNAQYGIPPINILDLKAPLGL